MDRTELERIVARLTAEVRKAVVGQDEVVSLILTALLSGGHVLLEGVPGTAKTLIAQSFAAALALRFGRIQFTPDLMPGDILGTNLFNFQTNEFTFTPGPIFAEMLLADEINRAPPKTQAALLQAMNERAVTIDGRTLELGQAFTVVATQNPIEQQGTYPLPEAQLDRFLFKLVLDYPDRDQERQIVARHGHQAMVTRPDGFGIAPVVGPEDIAAARQLVADVVLSEPLVGYVVDLVRATRQHPAVETGASTRSASMLASAARARAALAGRDYVIPDDIKGLALPLLRHRIGLGASALIDGLGPDRILQEIIDATAAPR